MWGETKLGVSKMKKIWHNLKLNVTQTARSIMKSVGYLHSGSAIVYEGHIPAIYSQEGEE